jgi:S1-C subfamily serine protease
MFPEGYVDPDFPFAPPQMTQTVTVDAGQFPKHAPRPGGPVRDFTRRFGFDLVYPTRDFMPTLVANEVDPGGVAEQQGRLEPGDQVTGVNGDVIMFRADDLIAALGRAGPGGRVYVEGINVRTGTPFAPFFADLPTVGPLAGRLGVGVAEQPVELRGLRIGTVRQNSFAALLGLERGDVITKVNDREVLEVGDLEEALRKIGPGQAAVFRGVKVGNNLPFSIRKVLPKLD